jgi:macrolide transport system ATP-binding/permease protein
MYWLRLIYTRLYGLLRNDLVEQEMEEELRFHLRMQTRKNIEQGMKPDEAELAALRRFGNVGRIKDLGRDIKGGGFMETLLQDLRFGLRMLMKKPSFTFVAVLTLGLGIGANTAVFSLVNTILLRPLPIAHPEQVVTLNNGLPGQASFPLMGYVEYKDYRDRNQSLAGLAAFRGAPVNLSSNGINERVWSYYVTGNYFSLLGVGAALGRVIAPEDDLTPGAHPVVMLSYQCWQKRFGADSQIIDKSVLIGGRNYTVIGVTLPEFRGTELADNPELWFPMMMRSEIIERSVSPSRRFPPVSTIGRLKEGMSWAQAESDLTLIAAQLGREYPQSDEGMIILLSKPGLRGNGMRGTVLTFTAVSMGVVVLVLLLACTNLATLLLVRASERHKEIAIRLALGAGRARVLRQLLTESVLLALLGSALGLVLAYGAVELARFKMPVFFWFAPINYLQIDWRVLVFTLALSLLTGILLGFLPGLQATRPDVIPALKNESTLGGYRHSRLRNVLVVAQMSLSLVLLLCAGLVLRGLQRAQQIDPGFNPRNAVEVSFDLGMQQYDRERGREFQRQILERVRSLPGLQAATLTARAPLASNQLGKGIFIQGDEPKTATQSALVLTTSISLDYFRTMETRLLQGRDFTAQDDAQSSPVAIVNEAFARRFWPGENPIGKRFNFTTGNGKWIEIVGVAQDGKYSSVDEKPESFVYLPLAQNHEKESAVTLIARGSGDPNLLTAAIRNEIHELDGNLPLYNAQTMLEHMDLPLAPARIVATTLVGFGALALLLAAIGVFGVMSNAVTQRTHEIGIRIALGADSKEIIKLIVGQGALLVGTGVVIGLGGAGLGTRLLANLLFGVSALDPLTFAGVTALLTTTAFLACYLPARRATKVDPMVALRQE